jgi:hypothetical protein
MNATGRASPAFGERSASGHPAAVRMWRLSISPSSVSTAMSTTVHEADVPSASTQVKSNQNATASLSSRKTRRSFEPQFGAVGKYIG